MKTIPTRARFISSARIAGLLYLLQIPLGVFGIIYASQVLYVPGDTAATVNNILIHETAYRWSIVSAILCTLVTIATAVALYRLFRGVDNAVATAMVVFTLLYTPIAMINELNHVAILLLLKGTAYQGSPLETLVPFFFELHAYGIQVVGIFFGLWLLPMGWLVIKSEFAPTFIGYFLIIACVGYVADFFFYFLVPDAHLALSGFTFVGEVMMVLWLLFGKTATTGMLTQA